MGTECTIGMEENGDDLVIAIAVVSRTTAPTATILNYSGETMAMHQLLQGRNVIQLGEYRQGNYSIRVMNGNNIVVKKI